MYEPISPDSPHLSGIQPDWRDLPHLCEVVYAFWQLDDKSEEQIRDRLTAMGTPNKVENQLRLLSDEKLGLIDDEGNLMPDGVFLANQFTQTTQQQLSTETEVSIGSKENLIDAEKTILQSILFKRNWIPMLATVNQLITEDNSIKETDKRATEFRKRVNHLFGYEGVNSINSWKKKAQVHFVWAEELGLADEAGEIYEPTPLAARINENLQDYYHPDWPVK